MEKIEVKDAKVYFVQGTGKKSGKDYKALRIEFADSNLDKMVFLTKFELMAYEHYVKNLGKE
jgi:hypothetical protein